MLQRILTWSLLLISLAPTSLTRPPVLAPSSAHPAPSPSPSPVASAVSTPAIAQAYDLLLDDRVVEAAAISTQALLARPNDPEMLVLAGVVQIYLLDMEKAEGYFRTAQKFMTGASATSVNLHIRRGDLQIALSNFKAAEDEYRKAIALDPKSVLAYLDLATTLLQDQRVDEAKSLMAKASALHLTTKEERIAEIMNYLLMGDVKTCTRLLAEFQKSFADVSATLVLRALLEFRNSRFDKAREYLDEAAKKGVQNAFLLYQVATLLLSLNRIGEAHALLSLAIKRFPQSTKLAEQYKLVHSRYLSSQQMKSLNEGPFEVSYETSTSGALLRQIVGLCKKHYANLAKRLGYKPAKVVVHIFESTGFASPAYYNNLSGDITIAGGLFRQMTGKLGTFVTHALHHELTHLFLSDRSKGSIRSINCLWIDEGLAEYMAGGVGYIGDLDINLKEMFADGALSMSDLIGNINMLWYDNRKNVKAYAQSFYMVDFLISRSKEENKGLQAVTELLRQVAHDAPLEKAIPAVFKMTYAEFTTGWQAHLKARLH
jgi:tetratricopeptide (TPR) repeat protein